MPAFLSLFVKGSTSIAGPGDMVEVPKLCQDEQADYEGELVAIDRDGKRSQKKLHLIMALGVLRVTMCCLSCFTRSSYSLEIAEIRKWPKAAGVGLIWGALEIVLPNKTQTPCDTFLHVKTSFFLFFYFCFVLFSRETTLEAGNTMVTGTPERNEDSMTDPR